MQSLKKNTKNNFGLSEETTSLLLSTFAKFPQIEEIKVFGSRAKGNYKSGSDIDLAIFAINFTFNDLLSLEMEIEDLQLLYKIDCLNYYKLNNAALKEHIDLAGKTFYRAEQ